MTEPPRKRAKLACITCNARRVKCDVTDRQPCGNCVTADIHCSTRESRRGKHARKPRNEMDAAAEGQRHDQLYVHTTAHMRCCNVTLNDSSSSNGHFSPERHEDEVAASHVLASLSSNFHSPAESRVTQQFLSPAARPDSHGGPAKTDTPSHDDDTAVFLGESSSLRYVTDEPSPITPITQRRQSVLRFHHDVPNAIKEDSMIPDWGNERRRARMKILQADGTFSFPPLIVRIKLLKAYFQWFHPHFAIVDEADFWETHTSGSASPLLLQAMLFIGVIHCDQATLTELAWGDRHRAKWLLHIR